MPGSIKKGYVNVETKEDCFKYAFVSSVHYQEAKLKAANRCKLRRKKTWQEYFNKYNWDGVEKGDVTLSNIDGFELNNKINVNVFSHHGSDVIQIRKSNCTFPFPDTRFNFHTAFTRVCN